MIKAFLSRYRPRYVRSLAYMLQVSEYNVGDYLDWLQRTQDFSHVEHRKQLVKTPKALLIMALLWLVLLSLFALALSASWPQPSPLGYLLTAIGLIAAPYLAAYAIVIPLLLVKYTIQQPIEARITARAHQRIAKHPALKIAVAGSYGKTSMREIIRTVLAEGKRVAAPPHSYNTPLGISQFVEKLTGDEEVIVFELGEYYPGDVKKLSELVQPQLGVITGINEAHLHKFKTLDRTTATIFELADYLGTKPVYVNGENRLVADHATKDQVEYTREGAGNWKVENARTGLDGTKFTLVSGQSRLDIATKLLGLHQIGPLAAAADIALSLGLSSEQIQRGLAAVRPFDHRLQPVLDSSGVTTLDDSYNGNPDGVKAVIDFLVSLRGHRRFYVTPGLVEMGERTQAVHEEIGRQLAAAGIEQVVLIRNSATPHIATGLSQASYQGKLTWYDDGLAAFAALPHLTVKGDVVLLQNDWPDQYS